MSNSPSFSDSSRLPSIKEIDTNIEKSDDISNTQRKSETEKPSQKTLPNTGYKSKDSEQISKTLDLTLISDDKLLDDKKLNCNSEISRSASLIYEASKPRSRSLSKKTSPCNRSFLPSNEFEEQTSLTQDKQRQIKRLISYNSSFSSNSDKPNAGSFLKPRNHQKTPITRKRNTSSEPETNTSSGNSSLSQNSSRDFKLSTGSASDLIELILADDQKIVYSSDLHNKNKTSPNSKKIQRLINLNTHDIEQQLNLTETEWFDQTRIGSQVTCLKT